jgi:hypothetical protein
MVALEVDNFNSVRVMLRLHILKNVGNIGEPNDSALMDGMQFFGTVP